MDWKVHFLCMGWRVQFYLEYGLETGGSNFCFATNCCCGLRSPVLKINNGNHSVAHTILTHVLTRTHVRRKFDKHSGFFLLHAPTSSSQFFLINTMVVLLRVPLPQQFPHPLQGHAGTASNKAPVLTTFLFEPFFQPFLKQARVLQQRYARGQRFFFTRLSHCIAAQLLVGTWECHMNLTPLLETCLCLRLISHALRTAAVIFFMGIIQALLHEPVLTERTKILHMLAIHSQKSVYPRLSVPVQ